MEIDHTVMVRHIPKEEIPRQRCCEHVKTEQDMTKMVIVIVTGVSASKN